jgi:hypothetical protein
MCGELIVAVLKERVMSLGVIATVTVTPVTVTPTVTHLATVTGTLQDWLAFAFLIGLFGVAGALVGHNLLRRRRAEIVYGPPPPEPDGGDYTPTAAEDADYDRNKAAGSLPIYGEVNGRWGKLRGKDLEEAQRDFRRTDWIFLGVGLGSMLLAIGFFFGGLWVASLLLLPFGALFCYASYLSLRHR